MHDLETLKSGGYRGAGLTQLRLACPLTSFPEEILELGDTLEQLDLSGTGLSSLPTNLGSALPKLKSAVFSNCTFKVFPRVLASCANLETVVFRNNGMEKIPEDAFPPHLRCLVLTGNCLTSVPSSISRCDGLEQCLLVGNQLRDLPPEMADCKKLSTLRLSSNNISTLPSWLYTLPDLRFLSFANNPCASPATNGIHTPRGLASIAWSDLEIQQSLDADTSQGLWHQSPHYAEDVAIKLFRDPIDGTDDDGFAADEMSAYLAAGAHESLVTILGQIHGHPDEDDATTREEGEGKTTLQGGIVTQLLLDSYIPLSTFTTPSTTTTEEGATDNDAAPSLDTKTALQMLTGIASCLAHLHSRGIAHGSVRPETVFASAADAHALLTHFRAATRYGGGCSAAAQADEIEKVEVLAFGRVIDFVLGVVDRQSAGGGGGGDDEKEGQGEEVETGLRGLRDRCVAAEVTERPGFEEVVEVLEGMMGWRGMMRIPDVVPA
ncbi:hypothetical protein C7999DRAFT_34795 [Corynascus novoguineensis]|uniref:Protein kinase domain-containing protein n=1 Tax=Corynascus novoguineensis TaxID=1126955 RepID=A0AAN7CPG1_9PEZI|nr:hypothetical protein C7999DRAFT_34795 [Corynascus novoguineensis]